MKIELPLYNSYQKSVKLDIIEVNDDDYCETIEKVSDLIDIVFFDISLKKIVNEYNALKIEIDTSIATNKEMPFINKYRREWKRNNIDWFKNMKDTYQSSYDKLDDLYKLFVLNCKKTGKFMRDNRDDIFLMIDNKIKKIENNKKSKRQLQNKAYYEKNKPLTPEKVDLIVELSVDEKKSKRQLQNKAYYEKNKPLTPEKLEKVELSIDEKKLKRQLQNKVFYEKRHPLKLEKIELSVEDKIMKRKLYNKEYYEKRKSKPKLIQTNM